MGQRNRDDQIPLLLGRVEFLVGDGHEGGKHLAGGASELEESVLLQ